MAHLLAFNDVVNKDFHLGVKVALALVMGDDSLFGTVEGKPFTLGTRANLCDIIKTKHHIL